VVSPTARDLARRRLQDLWSRDWSVGDLVELHSAHKYLLMAHSPEAYSELGRLVARAKSIPRDELRAEYETGLLEALSRAPTVGRHVNVLLHLAGYFREGLDPGALRERHQAIKDYRGGRKPLSEPLALIAGHARRLGLRYLESQVYLELPRSEGPSRRSTTEPS